MSRSEDVKKMDDLIIFLFKAAVVCLIGFAVVVWLFVK